MHIKIIGSVIPIIPEQNLESTASHWALSHLKAYEEAYNYFLKISICQEHFNEKITKFLKLNKEHLINLVEADSIRDKDKIELFVRYYLYKIVEANTPNKNSDYSLSHLDRIKISENEDLYNPFPEKENDIIQDLKLNYSNNRKVMDEFDRDITTVNTLILEFQNSLRSIIDNSITGLKGSCTKEKQLSYFYGIKSFFTRCWHFVSK
jgi:hypothetical protein